MAEGKKVAFNMRPEAASALQALRGRQFGTTDTDAINRALVAMAELLGPPASRREIFYRDGGGQVVKITFL